MNPKGLIPALALVVMGASQAVAAPKLDVQLTVANPVLQGDVDVVVNVTITNNTRQVASLAPYQLPSAEADAKLFEIRREGKLIRDFSPIVKRMPAQASEMVLLQPGASLSYQVELTGSYDLSQNGRYSIEYVGLAKHGGGGASGAPLYVWLEGRSAKAPVDPTPPGGPGLSYSGNCSASQQTTIASAVSAATSYAQGAASYLAGTPSATPRYTTWFGAFNTAGWNTAKAHFNAEVDAFTTKPITVDCKCRKSNIYAYVYPTKPYVIYVCGAFWAAPMTGTDSKAGTLIHEMSHFNVVAGTDDWAYGQAAAKALALSNPTNALDNADSHEYFAENTPAQP